MPKIELQYLLRPTTTPEQEIFLTNFYTQFDNGGAHKQIVNVEPLFYQGVIAATEFLTYAATKLYISYNLGFSAEIGVNVAYPLISLYDETNTNSINLTTSSILYNTSVPAISYGYHDLNIKNIFFSRITLNVYNRIIFNGYRITLN